MRAKPTEKESTYRIRDLGGGRFAITGAMTFHTAGRLLRECEQLFSDHTRIEVDLSAVNETDSAGLALMLEWITWANHTVREIRFIAMPGKIGAIARTTEVEDLLTKGERWAGFIEAPSTS